MLNLNAYVILGGLSHESARRTGAQWRGIEAAESFALLCRRSWEIRSRIWWEKWTHRWRSFAWTSSRSRCIVVQPRASSFPSHRTISICFGIRNIEHYRCKCDMLQSTYILPGPVISAHPVVVQNSLMVPYTRLTCSKSASAENESEIVWL